MEERKVKHPQDPDHYDWEYDCDGNKVVKGDFTTPYHDYSKEYSKRSWERIVGYGTPDGKCFSSN